MALKFHEKLLELKIHVYQKVYLLTNCSKYRQNVLEYRVQVLGLKCKSNKNRFFDLGKKFQPINRFSTGQVTIRTNENPIESMIDSNQIKKSTRYESQNLFEPNDKIDSNRKLIYR